MSRQDHHHSPDEKSATTPQALQLGDPQTCVAGNGWVWIKKGFELFTRAVTLWLAMVLAYMVVMALLSFAPLPGVLLGLIAPLFTAGFMVASHRADSQGRMDFMDMFEGFKRQTRPLLVLGLIYIGFVFLIGMVLGSLIMTYGVEDIFLADPETMPEITPEAYWIMLFAVLMFIPLAMGMWFSPALIVFHSVSAWRAFKLSLRGCIKNFWPLLAYGIILLPFGLLAAMPFGLGFLILIPVVMCSVYVSYRDIFLQKKEEQESGSLVV